MAGTGGSSSHKQKVRTTGISSLTDPNGSNNGISQIGFRLFGRKKSKKKLFPSPKNPTDRAKKNFHQRRALGSPAKMRRRKAAPFLSIQMRIGKPRHLKEGHNPAKGKGGTQPRRSTAAR